MLSKSHASDDDDMVKRPAKENEEPERVQAEKRQKAFEAALEECNRKYAEAFKKLAE